MKPGRNDPCPCGTGKKFKHCHGRTNQAQETTQEAAWRRLRRALDGYPPMMLRFVSHVFGPDVIDEAWGEFTLWETDEPHFDRDTPHMEVFLPWFFHSWKPDPLETSIEDPSLHDRSPTSVLLARRSGRLDPVLRRYLAACVDSPFSFHEVLRCDPGRGLRTRNLFTGEEHEVLERSASRTLEAGDTLFGQLVSAEGITVVEACGRYPIPPREKLGLIDFRERITRGVPLSSETLKDWDIEVRDEYLHLVDRLVNPAAPHLQNTDGEDIVFHRLFFEIDSPREALSALKPLALDTTEEDLLGEAEFDADGELRRVAFAWTVAGNVVHRSWENTVHGHIEIADRELRAEVNSAERAARLMGILEDRLGQAIRYKHTEIESIEDAMARHQSSPPAASSSEETSWQDSPEVRNRIRELTAAHYESWVSEPIPALDGLTPLEAVRDRVGREKVEALITDMERHGSETAPSVDEGVIATIRERLGLVRIPRHKA